MMPRNKFKIGDQVRIRECPPLSKSKNFEVLVDESLALNNPAKRVIIMIQMQANLDVADNSGAKRVMCIKVLVGSKRKFASSAM